MVFVVRLGVPQIFIDENILFSDFFIHSFIVKV